MTYRLGLLVMLIGVVAQAFTPAENEKLGGVMRAIAKDVGVVTLPTTEAAPVKDDDVMNALIRTRTANYLFQMALTKVGVLNADGSFTPDEMTPGGFSTLAAAELKPLLEQYTGYLTAAQKDLSTAETQLQTLYNTPAASRDFTALKATLADLANIEKEGHTGFKPPQN